MCGNRLCAEDGIGQLFVKERVAPRNTLDQIGNIILYHFKIDSIFLFVYIFSFVVCMH